MIETHPTTRRLHELDALRGIAAMSVMIFHYTSAYNDKAGHALPGVSLLFPYGNFGVELFFIISGFVISMTMERGHGLTDFLVSRFARLYPAFLASMVVTIFATLALGGDHGTYSGERILANLTMAPQLFGFRDIDGSYWSLMYELVFYLLGATVYFGLRPRMPESACAIWLVASLAMRVSGQDYLPPELVRLTAAPFSQLFVIGIMLYRSYSGRATPFTWAVLALAFAMTSFGPHSVLNDLSRAGYFCLMVGFAGLVWLVTTPRIVVPDIGFPRFLGRISYPLYLVHQDLGFIVIGKLERAHLSPDLAVAVTAGLAIAVAWVISASVEYKAQAWLLARYRAWRDRPMHRGLVSEGGATGSP